jgi:hypothetical protein
VDFTAEGRPLVDSTVAAAVAFQWAVSTAAAEWAEWAAVEDSMVVAEWAGAAAVTGKLRASSL